jgi:hypothetical protein
VKFHTEQVWDIIQKIRSYYNTKIRIRKLRSTFLGAFEGKGSISHECRRKIADNWRCVAFALENEVPIDIFVLTNYDRMEKKLRKRAGGVIPLPGGSPCQSVVGSSEVTTNTQRLATLDGPEFDCTEDIESESSTFESLDLLVELDDFPINRVIDLNVSFQDNLEVCVVDAQPSADASGKKTSQAPKEKKKKKSRKRKRSSSGRSVTSKFVRVLDGDVFVFHSITAIFRKSSC